MNKDDNDIKFKLSVRSYNELLMMLARFFMIDEMKRVFTKMLNDMILANIYTLNTMVNTYSKMGNIL